MLSRITTNICWGQGWSTARDPWQSELAAPDRAEEDQVDAGELSRRLGGRRRGGTGLRTRWTGQQCWTQAGGRPGWLGQRRSAAPSGYRGSPRGASWESPAAKLGKRGSRTAGQGTWGFSCGGLRGGVAAAVDGEVPARAAAGTFRPGGVPRPE